jgi:phosphomevalonate kinase
VNPFPSSSPVLSPLTRECIAGGYDAIWLIVTDPTDCSPEEKPVARVESVWTTWTELSVTPLAAVESAAKGARVEVLEEVPGLKDAILES